MRDLHELLETAKGDPPPARYGVDDIVAAGRRRRRRMVTGQIGGAAGLVAVAATTAILLTGGSVVLSPRPPVVAPRPATGPPPVAIPPLTFMFDGYRVGKLQVLPPQTVTTSYQSTWIVSGRGDGIRYVGTLTLYRPGVPVPTVFTTGTGVMVNGRPGFANERAQDRNGVVNGSGSFAIYDTSIRVPTLAWQYVPGGWAVINGVVEYPHDAGRRLTADDELAIAERFGLGSPSRARMPFRARYLPDGWQVVAVTGRGFNAEDVRSVTVIYAPPSAAGTDRVRHFTDTGDGPAVVMYIGERDAPPPDAPKKKSTCGSLYQGDVLRCSWAIPRSHHYVNVHDPSGTLSKEELIRIGEGLVFGNLDKPSTWREVP